MNAMTGRALLLTAMVMLTSTACDLFDVVDAEITDNVKREIGLDINNPTVMVELAGAARVAGDQERAAALDLLRDTRRVQHQLKGDARLQERDFDGAIAEYREAVKWSEPSVPERLVGENPQRAFRRTEVQAKLGISLLKKIDALEAQKVPVTRGMYLDSAKVLELAARGYPAGSWDRQTGGRLSAYSYHRAGDTAAACKTLQFAMGDQPSSIDFAYQEAWGC